MIFFPKNIVSEEQQGLFLSILALILLLMVPISGHAQTDSVLVSKLETYNIETGQRKVVYRTRNHIEAPNWSPDGSYFLFNSEGKLYTLPVGGGEPDQLDTGFATNCNNDHGFSPDGQWLAVSHSPEGEGSKIYVLPAEGGTPRLVTPRAPSYWHGWSPDGSTLVYPAQRNGEFDLYAIPVEGGEETRLTTAPGLDDGAEYTPDGKWIYFNSVRSGVMKIYRMHPDGSEIQQLTSNEEYGDWFPHVSPDGEKVVFLSYDADVEGHPPFKEVVLRLMPLDGGTPEVVVELFGGQGTINVPSWSPDSKRFAFVSYEFVSP
ncbi:TolB family protein [Fodinibius sp.]|uniref:TolB family protein n=1 Tax=Fodinibius sp. TaxID=1872440 RepID=UPI00356262F7